jgi:Ca2+-binding EF-hand superfamily protein
VSYQDFADKVKQLQINAPAENLVALAKFLDKEGKGYLDFKNFSERFNNSLPALLTSKDLQDSHNVFGGGAIVPNRNTAVFNDKITKEAAVTYRSIDKAL